MTTRSDLQPQRSLLLLQQQDLPLMALDTLLVALDTLSQVLLHEARVLETRKEGRLSRGHVHLFASQS